MIKQKIKGIEYTKRKIINNLNRYIDLATPEDIEEGKRWYHNARNFCIQMSNQYGVTIEQAAGITSVFSPQTSWDINKGFCRSFLASNGKANVTMLMRCNKARKMLKTTDPKRIGELLSVKENSGLKTKAFYENILHPDEAETTVIDRHQIAASTQRPEDTMALSNSQSSLTPAQYYFLSDCNKHVARKRGLSVPSCQAIIWGSYRNARGLFQHKPNEFELQLPVMMEVDPF